jgi:transketolase
LEITKKNELIDIAKEIRIDIVKMLTKSKSGHPGGSLSIADIMSYLYFHGMNIDIAGNAIDRDRFILSKGHAAPVLYATLAKKGFFDKEALNTLRTVDSQLQGHPHRLDTSGVEASTGSLGQGLSIAVGMGLGLKLDKLNSKIYVILGDGESQEGQIWEAAMSAGFRKLNNLCVFLDYNNLQIDGKVSEIKDILPVSDKWRAFNWNVIEIDGHNFDEIDDAVINFKNEKEKPTLIVSKTVKGKGVSFMENNVNFHGVTPTDDELIIALRDLKNG